MARFARVRRGPLAIVIVTIAVVAAVIVGLSKLGYSTIATYPASSDEAAKLEAVEGSDIPRIILSADAAEKMGLRTAPVTAQLMLSKPRLSIPYAAVFYDPSGATWTYVAREPLVFTRQAITVVSIQETVAVLSAGPAAGTPVVTVGSAQLYGIETGVEEK